MVTWCSWRSLVDASSEAASRWSVAGSPPRGAVPAMGWERTMSPATDTSSSGLAATNAADAHDVAARVGGPQALEHGQAVDRPVGGDVDLAGQHDLVEGAAGHRLGRPLDQVAPPLGAVRAVDRVALRLAAGGPRPDQVDASGLGSARGPADRVGHRR